MTSLGIGMGTTRTRGRGEPAIITATTAPSLSTLTDSDTVQSAYTAGSYASTAGTISSAVETVTINGASGALSDVVSFDDVVSVSVLVTDSEGNTRTFSAGTTLIEADVPEPFAADAWAVIEADVPDAFTAVQWDVDENTSTITKPATTAPSGTTAAPVISQDHATYGTYVSQCIPTVCVVGQRVFRIEYGLNDVEPGTFAEGPGSYCRLSFTDLDAAVADPFEPSNWTKAVYLVPNSPTEEVADTFLTLMSDGRMLITAPTRPATTPATKWGCILQNPLDDPANWNFGPWCYLGMGFTGHPHMHGGQIRMIISETGGTIRYGQINSFADTVEFELLSEIPLPSISSTDLTYHEVSIVRVGLQNMRMTMRTRQGVFTATSDNAGLSGSWTTPIKLAWDSTAVNSKTDLIQSPSGNYIFVYNRDDSASERRNMTVAIIADDEFSLEPDIVYTFDPRGASGARNGAVSYPNVDFLSNLDGSYSGEFIVAYDRGRGSVIDSETDDWMNDIFIAVFNEQELLAENFNFTRYNYPL